MDSTQCSSGTVSVNTIETIHDQDEINELRNSEDIIVWGLKQEDLEQQALNEIEKFAEQRSKDTQHNLEDGEILDNPDNDVSSNISAKQNLFLPLDVQRFIKRQEELQKNQGHIKKHCAISEKSKHISDEISKRQNEISEIKCKRKRSRKSSDNEKICKISQETGDVKQAKILKLRNNSDSEYVPSEEDSSG